MERFDIETFRKKAVDGEYVFVTDQKVRIRQWQSSPAVYVQETSLLNSPEMLYQEFYAESGQLKLSGKEFHGMAVGVWKEYSKTGRETNEWDEDEKYEFTIDELAAKMKDLGVDIKSVQKGITVSRTDAGPPYYYVTYPINPLNPYDLHKLTIDGITGKTLAQETVKSRN